MKIGNKTLRIAEIGPETSFKDAALAYAAAGFPVIPVLTGCHLKPSRNTGWYTQITSWESSWMPACSCWMPMAQTHCLPWMC